MVPTLKEAEYYLRPTGRVSGDIRDRSYTALDSG